MSTLAPVSFGALGTTAVLVANPAEATRPALEVLRDELAVIDETCSRFREDSELVRLNSAAGRWRAVSAALLEAIEVALLAARQTDGAVDPTIGGAMRLIGYDRDFSKVARDGPPLELMIAPVPGWQQVEVDRSRSRVRVPAGVEIDLGATAKALAADRAARRAARVTAAGVLVGLGGDLSMAGEPPQGGWLVRVTDDHRGPLDAFGQTVSVESGGLATSSTVARSWRRGGRTLHHIVDPSTGMPADGYWRTVSVAASSCVDANTAATAALVKGAEAPDWLEGSRLPARLVSLDGYVRTVGAWPSEEPLPATP